MVQTAVDEFISRNKRTVQDFGYHLKVVKIPSPESITIKVVSLKTRDIKNYRCRYHPERCGFVSA